LPAFRNANEQYPLWLYGSHGALYKAGVESAPPGVALGEAAGYIIGTDVTTLSDDRTERILTP
ncbi:MAG: hypothetical protein KBS76_07850, partial [Ruminococcus sp.]|nr:hypothetical protein [Candidatus Apopatosoma intestinale]